MPSSLFESLPHELLVEILRHLSCAPCDSQPEAWHSAEGFRSRNLATLLHCSKVFFLLIEPILYSSYRIEQDDTRDDTWSLPKFLQTLLCRPDLARKVKNFAGAIGGDYYEMKDITAEECSGINIILEGITRSRQRCESWAYNLGTGVGEFGEPGTNWAEPDALNALVMSLLPNLESIEISGSHVENCSHTAALLDRATKVQKSGRLEEEYAMAKVRAVSLKKFGSERPRRHFLTHLAMPFLALPSVKYFFCHGLDELPMTDEFRQITHSDGSNILSVRFSQSNIPAHGLRVLGRLCPKLRSFHYESAYDDWPEFSLIFGGAIEHLSDSLEELLLTGIGREWIVHKALHPTKPIRSLASFVKMKRLEGSARCLIGDEDHNDNLDLDVAGATLCPKSKFEPSLIEDFMKSLPPSLESLTVTQCHDSIFEVMYALLQGSLPPTFAKLTVSFDPLTVDGEDFERRSQRDRWSLEQAVSQRGIKLKWNHAASTA